MVIGELASCAGCQAACCCSPRPGSPHFLDLAPVGVRFARDRGAGPLGLHAAQVAAGEVTEVTVPGDRDRLAVALDALLENAIAHTDKDDRIELSARVEDGHVILAVADSGCGIPAADLERVFGRFSRATPYLSRESGGFGLGLPTVAAIAEAHHGSVRAQQHRGRGSTFQLLDTRRAGPVNASSAADCAARVARPRQEPTSAPFTLSQVQGKAQRRTWILGSASATPAPPPIARVSRVQRSAGHLAIPPGGRCSVPWHEKAGFFLLWCRARAGLGRQVAGQAGHRARLDDPGDRHAVRARLLRRRGNRGAHRVACPQRAPGAGDTAITGP